MNLWIRGKDLHHEEKRNPTEVKLWFQQPRHPPEGVIGIQGSQVSETRISSCDSLSDFPSNGLCLIEQTLNEKGISWSLCYLHLASRVGVFLYKLFPFFLYQLNFPQWSSTKNTDERLGLWPLSAVYNSKVLAHVASKHSSLEFVVWWPHGRRDLCNQSGTWFQHPQISAPSETVSP